MVKQIKPELVTTTKINQLDLASLLDDPKNIEDLKLSLTDDCGIGQLWIKPPTGKGVSHGTVAAVEVSFYDSNDRLTDSKVVMYTAASRVLVEDVNEDTLLSDTPVRGYKYVSKLMAMLKKKNDPQQPEDFGLIVPLTIDRRHIFVPAKYNGNANCGHDIAIIKVPEDYQ